MQKSLIFLCLYLFLVQNLMPLAKTDEDLDEQKAIITNPDTTSSSTPTQTNEEAFISNSTTRKSKKPNKISSLVKFFESKTVENKNTWCTKNCNKCGEIKCKKGCKNCKT